MPRWFLKARLKLKEVEYPKTAAMKKYIDTRFLEICSLEELSYHFGYTYSYLSKTFKKTYGVTPVEYILKKKID